MYIYINKASLCKSISCLKTNSNCEPIGVWQQLNIIIYQAFLTLYWCQFKTFLNQKVEDNSSCMLSLKKQFLLPMISMKTSLSDSTDQTCDLQSGTLRSRSINWVFKDSSAVSQQPSCHKYCALHWRVFLLWWCHDCLPFVLNRKSLKPTPTPKVLSSQMPINDGESNMYLLLHTYNHKRLKSTRMLKKKKNKWESP